MREHNFQISDTRGSVDPLREIWECKQCNSMVSFLKGMTIGQVNRHMVNRLACLDPMHELQQEDNEGDNQMTYALKKKESTVDRISREIAEGRREPDLLQKLLEKGRK